MLIIHVYRNGLGDWVCWIETGKHSKNIECCASFSVHEDKNQAIVTALERAEIEFTDSET